MRLLVDTNVFLEHILQREKKQEAYDFFYLAAIRRNQTVVTSMSLRDIGYAIHKRFHDENKTRQMQIEIYGLVSKVISTSADAAIDSLYSDNNDYEDAMQAIAAEEAMCDAIITFDKKGFKQAKLPVFTPGEICEIWLKSNK